MCLLAGNVACTSRVGGNLDKERADPINGMLPLCTKSLSKIESRNDAIRFSVGELIEPLLACVDPGTALGECCKYPGMAPGAISAASAT